MIIRMRVCAALGMMLALSGCSDSTGPDGMARVRILLTDAPADYIAEAMVDIGAVELLPADDGERIVLSEDGTDGALNLLDLQGSTTTLLAEAEIEAGSYREIRLIVESASVTLMDGYLFDDGSATANLTVPSGAQTGIKLKLAAANEDDGDDASADDGDVDDGGVTISDGETVLVLDFDVNQSFRIQGNPMTPAGIRGMHFQPVLRVIVEDAAGSISGTVSTALAGVSVEGLVVTAEPSSDEQTFGAYQTTTATGTTDANGAYTIFFVVPGTYDVVLTPPAGLVAAPDTIEVVVGESEVVTDVDFTVISG